ncbi:MAG: hypothetical protein JWP84_323 [Tardiphaga sp.]|nr:hypothetical protein [Tardiphaga sp.]
MPVEQERAQNVTPKKKRKRKMGRPRVERVYHVIEIRDWHWDYMFGVAVTKFSSGPYDDFRHLVIEGAILRPKALAAAKARLTCFAEYRLVESERKSTDQPKAVGWISHRGKDYSANLHMPADVLNPVLQMMAAGKYRYVFMEAEKSYRGEAAIRLYRFSELLTEDDLSG